MALGGARPGAGRPKGSMGQKTNLAMQRIADGLLPIEVLINDMRFYYTLGESKMQECMVTEPGKKQANAFRAACAIKTIARDCAIAAAPYVHPKLANIQANMNVQNHEARLATFRDELAPAMSSFVNEVVENDDGS